VAVLTFNGETDAFTDGGWNSVGSDAQISGHVVTANFIQIQMSPLPFGHYTPEHHNRNQSIRIYDRRKMEKRGHIYIESHAPTHPTSISILYLQESG
jgi:putative NADPH-quinone reductase